MTLATSNFVQSLGWGFPFNIYAVAVTSDFKFGTQLGFANYAHHKITQMTKVPHGMVLYKIWPSPLIFLEWLKLQWRFQINGII